MAFTFANGSPPEVAPSRIMAEIRPASWASVVDFCSRASFRTRLTTSKFARSARVCKWELDDSSSLPWTCKNDVELYTRLAAPPRFSLMAFFAPLIALSSSALLRTDVSWSDALVMQSLFVSFRKAWASSKSFCVTWNSPTASALVSVASCIIPLVTPMSLLSTLSWSWRDCRMSSKLCFAFISSRLTSWSWATAFCFKSSSTSVMLSLRDL
mmetsp:Transcript_57723/g.160907  ORF Transcript_57723/g.160907 Transcript_57723/m.160907 type:complete len:212 (-) Transcript_57723:753-1388(-)